MSEIISALPVLLSGTLTTLILMLAALACGGLLAVSMCIVHYLSGYLVRKVIDGLVFFICGTPLLVQIFLLYYGIGQFVWVRDSFLWVVLSQPMACAIISLSINTACYTFVLLVGAIKSVPYAEIEASAAVGMSKWLALRRIVLPRAFRFVIPAYSNEVLMILKSTSLASTITILDLMGVTQALIAQTYMTVTFYILAAIIYLLLTNMIYFWFRKIQTWSTVHVI